MKHQAEMTRLLRDAVRKLARNTVRELLPPHMTVWISHRDTGCRIWIKLFDDAESASDADIRVWDGSIRYGSSYEFNDRNKTLGLNRETEFARGPIEEFFSKVESVYVKASLNDIANEEQRREEPYRARCEKPAHFCKLSRQ